MDIGINGSFGLAAAILAVLAGFVIAVWASQHAVRRSTEIAAASRIPRFIIGITFLAVGTDLPELANSVVSSIAGHGDSNVGDSGEMVMTSVVIRSRILMSHPFG